MKAHKKNISPATRQFSANSSFAVRMNSIDGSHPLQEVVGDFCVLYNARVRRGGKLAYFNSELALEMGLIDSLENLPPRATLEKIVLNTFSLQIINEYDIKHRIRFNPQDIKPKKYMATRYLQLQHDNKRGKHSGDGRSIWNGQFKAKGRVWDISSCGTGATSLSPAAAKLGKPIRSGDPDVCYGCGYGDYYDGLGAALMSEIFHKQGIPTERTLAVIRFAGGKSINVRVGENLLRPAHFFRYLKLGDLDNLKKLCDHFIQHEIKNGNSELSSGPQKYRDLGRYLAEAFARSAAMFERKYIFCWFAWDGDNILAKDASILDYGSVRQFGLFHKEYRYDDVDRWSTNIVEQRSKARYIVQTIDQMIDAIENGKIKSVKKFINGPLTKAYDKSFAEHKKRFLLAQCGLPQSTIEACLTERARDVAIFEKAFEYFERLQSSRGTYEVSDGISSDAIFCMRDLLRELPKEYLAKWEPLSVHDLIDCMKSSYATYKELRPTAAWKRQAAELQKSYQRILQFVAQKNRMNLSALLLEVIMRSSVLNRFDRLTGNGILEVTEYLEKQYSFTNTSKVQGIADSFIRHQGLKEPSKKFTPVLKTKEMKKLIHLVEINREEV